METAQELLYNPQTGEVIDEPPEAEDKLRSEYLPAIAYRIRAYLHRIDLITEYHRNVMAMCKERAEKYRSQIEYLTNRAKLVLEQLGEAKLEYPGLGVFKTIKGREYVDNSAYESMSDDEKLKVQSIHKGCFSTRKVTMPDLREIAKRLKEFAAGESEVKIPGFEIKRSDDRFTFKPE